MKFTKFIIKNFKGIKYAELNLNQLGQGKIFTLVGLNESGKTTILEAINSFLPDLEAEKLYQNDIFRKVKPKDLVPKHNKDNFSSNVEIDAFIEYSEGDRFAIKKYFEEQHGLQIDLKRLEPILKVTKQFHFDQSECISQKSLWSISLYVKKKKERSYKEIGPKNDVWQKAVNYIRTLIPTICYFPTFLFEFPARVYLSHTPEQYEPQNAYYKQIIQDILDSLDRNLTIEEHIVNRVEKTDKGNVWDFLKFFQSDRKEQVDAVMNHLGNQITRTVFARWNEIFKSKSEKNIKLSWGVEGTEQNPPIYLSFSVQEGVSTYSIAERSLGFRWFFCFLLFTQFRRSRKNSGTLFLLDEPASNLHATAQQQLLSSFSSITEGNNSLIYSTHSHYMINPKWLEGAFIVQNVAIKYDDELSEKYEYHINNTDIRITPYKKFVGENNDNATYYQPILDALDYKPAVIEHQSNTVMVEGKSDFYLFSYFIEIIFNSYKHIRFLPSSSANGLGPLISLYLGWGYSFKILLDDDRAGNYAKQRYIKEWFLNDSIVSTIGDQCIKFRKKKLESLISTDGKAIITKALGVKKLTKKAIARFFQDNYARGEKVVFDNETVLNIETLIKTLYEHFKSIE